MSLVMMTLKRKRSFDELPSSPFSFTTTFGSPTDQGQGTSFLTAPSATAADDTSRARLANPCHLHSRTLKRVRNNRPSQEEIHQRTLQLLYTGQRRQQQQQQNQDASVPSPDVDELSPQQVENLDADSRSQQSLHQFWNIASQPPSSSSSAASSAIVEPPTRVYQQP